MGLRWLTTKALVIMLCLGEYITEVRIQSRVISLPYTWPSPAHLVPFSVPALLYCFHPPCRSVSSGSMPAPCLPAPCLAHAYRRNPHLRRGVDWPAWDWTGVRVGFRLELRASAGHRPPIARAAPLSELALPQRIWPEVRGAPLR